MSTYQEGPFETRRFEILTSTIYVGSAPQNLSESATGWTITKITLDASGNPTKSESTQPYRAVWNDRATETYG